MTTEIETLHLDQIRIDGGTQPRAEISDEVVAEYAGLYVSGVDLPPVVVFYDGAAYWLADGFHRYWANKRIECDYVFAEVRPGTKRDAVLYSVGANATHGLRRTTADRRRAVLTLLEDEEWRQWSDREIARRCGVDHKTVGAARKGLAGEIPQRETSRRVCKTKHGTTTKMDTSRIGRGKSKKKRGQIAPNAKTPIRKSLPALPQTNLNLPHTPMDGARAVVSAMGSEYGLSLAECLITFIQNRKEGVA